ncbi:hypothetical protein [Streptomyces tendae]
MTHSSLTQALAAALADDLWFVEGGEDEHDSARALLEQAAEQPPR